MKQIQASMFSEVSKIEVHTRELGKDLLDRIDGSEN